MEDQAEICAELKRLEQQLAVLAAEERIALPGSVTAPTAAALTQPEHLTSAAKVSASTSSSVPALFNSQQPGRSRVGDYGQQQNPHSKPAAPPAQETGSAAARAVHLQQQPQQQRTQQQHVLQPRHESSDVKLQQGALAAVVGAAAPGATAADPSDRPAGSRKSKQHRQATLGITPAAIQPLASRAPSAAAVGTTADLVTAAVPPAAAPTAAGQKPVELVQQLLQQHSKLLDLMQTMASTAKTQAERSARFEQQQQQQLQQHVADAAACSITAPASASAVGCPVSAVSAGSGSGRHAQQQQQQQYEIHLAEQHQLKKRFVKMQKVLLQHLQEARLQAAAAEAAREDACRMEQESAAAAAALHMQLLQQQQDAQMQQHELSCVRQQLLQVKELHKRKMQQLKQQLQQQYEVQLQATTAAYAQELAQIQTHLACSRKSGGIRASSATAAAAAAAAATAAGTWSAGQDMSQQNSRSPTPRLMQQPEQCMSSVDSPLRPLTRQHMQQPQQQDGPVPAEQIPLQQQQQQCYNGCQGLDVPAEVLEHAGRYQQGGEGSVRPPSAAPSVLQPQRCKEQPVPEVAAQLAQHFVTGGEGIGRPLSAPSSDRYGLPPHQQQQQQHSDGCSPPRSCRPSLRNSCEHSATAGASTSASVDLPSYILASNSLWDALCG